jgi:uncharacterized protein (DUF2141 family)
MSSQRIVIAAALALGLIAGAAQAGGRARVSILSAPKQLVAGQVFEVAFAVQSEFPMSKNRKIEPTVKAVCGDREITIAAVALKSTGHYKASFAVPAAGEWTITVDSRYCETRMTPLVLTAAPAKDKQS